MNITIKLPCCGQEKNVAASKVLGGERRMQDRKCSLCGCWWRVDVTLTKQSPGKLIHTAELTHIGQLDQRTAKCHA